MWCMNKADHAQPGESEAHSTNPHPSIAVCHDCRAQRLTVDFGSAKYTKGGRSTICKDCRAQYLRLSRNVRYNREPSDRDSHIRSVYGQNCAIIQNATTHPSTTVNCIGFIPHTDRTFKVQFGRNRYDLDSMAVYATDGSTYLEIAYSGLHPTIVMQNLTDALKAHGIRLESDEAAMIISKRVLYYL